VSDRFVSRAGEKLDAALDAMGLDVSRRICADFGCNVGGFTDCLLQRGAGKVYAVDTGYGALAWKLRQDPRVVVMERTNALWQPAPQPVDLVVVDVAWTPQTRIVPAAAAWLAPGGRIVSLLKPHYELAKARARKSSAPLPDDQARQVCLDVCARLAQDHMPPRAVMTSLLRGKGGNLEFLMLI
jgi:23S rRNA (cytidine1920-2'-O)/16S rRNA (cytidine1409-2'-O)-methyltransferase